MYITGISELGKDQNNAAIVGLNFDAKIIKTELNLLKKFGAKIKIKNKKIFIKGPENIKSINNIKTKEYPGVSTDMQSQLMVIMCLANGKGSITENIFENRFMHVPELNRMGANIETKGKTAVINPCKGFISAQVMATDLRASVSLILAGLVAKGETTLNRIYHLDRGYEKIEKKLQACGADIRRIN